MTILSLLEYSIKYNIAHIPSALSQFYYIKHIWKILRKNNTPIFNGKPYGAQAFYILEKQFNGLSKSLMQIDDVYPIIKHCGDNIGNTLGIAAGYTIDYNKTTYCNIGDATLQMGPTLEAIQFIGENKLPIILTIDINNYQLTRKISNRINYYKNIFYKWDVVHIKFGESLNIFNDYINTCKPVVFLIETKKGCGVKEMEDNPIEWHYKKLKDINDVTIS